jgi:HlyD family secretion protein
MANGSLKKRILKIIVSLAVVAALAAGGFFGWNWYQRRNRTAAMAAAMEQGMAATETVQRGNVQQIVTATGVVRLKDEQSVYGTGEAKVSEVLVEVGDRVTEGQKLVTYDVDDDVATLERQIREAEISLNNQRITLNGMALPATEQEIDQLQSSVDSAEKSLEDSKTTLENTLAKIDTQRIDINNALENVDKAARDVEINGELLAVGGISQSEFDAGEDALESAQKAYANAETALAELERQKTSNDQNIEYAEKNLETAKKRLSESGDTLSTEKERLDYKKQQNQIELSEIQLDDLRRQLNDVVYETTSPLSGTVTVVSVDKGSTVDEDSVLIKVADFTQLIVDASISVYDAPYIETGQSVTMTTDGLPDAVYNGKVTKISDQAATQSAMSGNETVVAIEVSVDNPDGSIKPGFNLDMEITTVDKDGAINVSTSAIVKDAQTGSHYVYKIDAERMLRRVDVTVGVYGDMTVEILSGLNEGDEIIASPTDTMSDGIPLRMTGGVPVVGGGTQQQNGLFGGQGGFMGGPGGGGNAARAPSGGGGAPGGGTMTFVRP